MAKEKENKQDGLELSLPMSYWVRMCENNIYMFAKKQFEETAIPVDLRPIVIKSILSTFQQEQIDMLINLGVKNAMAIGENRREVGGNANSD